MKREAKKTRRKNDDSNKTIFLATPKPREIDRRNTNDDDEVTTVS